MKMLSLFTLIGYMGRGRDVRTSEDKETERRGDRDR